MTWMLKLSLVFGLLLALPAGAGFAQDNTAQSAAALIGDVEAGEKRYRRQCRQCHGPTAKGVSSYPKLVGHSAEYLVDRLERYRAGEKIGPNTPLMAPQAKRLTDQDIADLTAFIMTFSES